MRCIKIILTETKLIKSPLNYQGNKFKLLPQILPLFPSNIDTFYDLFGGSFTVGINIEANRIIYNDRNTYLAELIQWLAETDINEAIENIHKVLKQFNMGKEKYNEFYVFRNHYNENKHPLLLFILGCHAFNYDIRFNSEGNFNKAYGNRSYNKNIEQRFIEFNQIAKSKNIEFGNFKFNSICNFKEDDFVYLDPPYLPTVTSYTENGGWNEENEKLLFNYIDEELDNKNIKFALSNVSIYRGKDNTLLNELSKKYNIHYLVHEYNNNNHWKKDNNTVTQEVLITNY